MSEDTPPEGYYGLQEASEKLTQLVNSREGVRLKAAAHYRVAGSGEGDDLIQEAFCRILSGDRKWPRSVPAVAFVIKTMQSIAYDWRKRRRTIVGLPDEPIPSLSPSPADVVEALSERQSALRSLEDDPEVHALAEAILDGWDTDQLLSLFDENQKIYETTRRRLRRRIEAMSRADGTSQCKTPPTRGRRVSMTK
jgi:DNA-directed RNA polymerase specialized sigma24 family protein